MITLLFQLAFFLFLTILCFTIPGNFLLTKTQIRLSAWANLVSSTVAGLVFFTLLSYFLQLIHLHSFLLLPILLMVILNLKNISQLKLNLKVETKKLLLLTLIFTLGIIGQLLIIAPSGLLINGDLSFWSAHGHDEVWHLALINEYQKGLPMQNPDLASEPLFNYHFFSDITLADFNYFFKLSSLDLLFRFFPFLYSLLLGSLTFLIGEKMGRSFWAGVWSTIFTYFAGSFGYVITFLHDQTIGGETIFWSSQVQSLSGNPPQIAALVILLTFLFLFTYLLDKPDFKKGLICTLLAGSLIEFKVYGAVVLLISLFLVSLWQIIKNHQFAIFLLSSVSLMLSLLLYLPNTKGSSNLLIFEPWWFIRTMVVAPDKLNWVDLELRRQTYLAQHNYFRVIQLEGEALLIFLIGNLGMRFLGFWQFIKVTKDSFNNNYSLLLLLFAAVSFLIPMFFIQKGVAGNTSQFLQYFLLIFGLLAGVSTAQLSSKINLNFIKIAITIIIIILAVPTQLGLFYTFYSRPPFAKVSALELQALDFLKNNSDQNAVILTPPLLKGIASKEPTPPIWIWSDTSYVSALSNRRVFFADHEQLDIMGYDYKTKQATQKQFFTTNDFNEFNKLLKENNISYLYFPKQLAPELNLNQVSYQKIFDNSEVEIWKVKPDAF